MSTSYDSGTSPDTDVVGARIVAQIVDLVLQFVLTIVLMFVSALALAQVAETMAEGGVNVIAFLLMVGVAFSYNFVLEWAWNGQTVGKKLVGIRVRDRFSAGPAGPGQVFVRNLPAVLVFSWLSIVVGLAAIAISNQNQRLFDQAASTIVTRA